MPKRMIYLLVLALVAAVFAKDSTLPKLVVHAKYVLVTTYYGDNLANARIPPDDRQAVADVENAIQDWGRYTLVYERKDADLIILVRKGRLAAAQQGIGVHAGTGQGTAVGTISNADAGDPRDTLAVYNAAQGLDSSPLWRGIKTDGLKSPEIPLLAEFRQKVEAAAKKP